MFTVADETAAEEAGFGGRIVIGGGVARDALMVIYFCLGSNRAGSAIGSDSSVVNT